MVVLSIQIFLLPTGMNNLVTSSLMNNIVETSVNNIVGPTNLLTHDNIVVQALFMCVHVELFKCNLHVNDLNLADYF